MITYKRLGQDFQLKNDDKSTREELMLLLQVHTSLLKDEDYISVLKSAINITDESYQRTVQAAYQAVKKHKLRDAWYSFTLSSERDRNGNKILMKQNHLIKKKVPNELLTLDVHLIIYGTTLMLKKVASETEVQTIFKSLLLVRTNKNQ